MDRADRIRRARERLGLTQEELAARIGVSRGSVRNWEAGGGIKNKLGALEEVLGISLAEESVGGGEQGANVMMDLPAGVLDGLSPDEVEEALSIARAGFIKRARDIRENALAPLTEQPV